MALPQSNTDSAAGVADDVDERFDGAGVYPDVVVGPVFPVPDLAVPLVQAASSSIAITAAVTRAKPRRVGDMTPVCHRVSRLQVRGDHAPARGAIVVLLAQGVAAMPLQPSPDSTSSAVRNVPGSSCAIQKATSSASRRR